MLLLNAVQKWLAQFAMPHRHCKFFAPLATVSLVARPARALATIKDLMSKTKGATATRRQCAAPAQRQDAQHPVRRVSDMKSKRASRLR